MSAIHSSIQPWVNPRLQEKAPGIHSLMQPWVNPNKTSGKGLWNPQLNPALRKHISYGLVMFRAQSAVSAHVGKRHLTQCYIPFYLLLVQTICTLYSQYHLFVNIYFQQKLWNLFSIVQLCSLRQDGNQEWFMRICCDYSHFPGFQKCMITSKQFSKAHLFFFIFFYWWWIFVMIILCGFLFVDCSLSVEDYTSMFSFCNSSLILCNR